MIITSRNPNWGGVAESLQVEKFQRDESIEFLLTRTGEPDQVAANELAEELGDLPLALEQARAYVERTGGTLSHYLSLFRDRFQELWRQDEPPQSYDQTIATTWSMSIEQLPQAAADLLNFCAFFAPDDIPRELIAGAAGKLPQPLASVVSDDLALDGAVAELRSYSMLEVGGDSWSVHRLVQAVVRGRLSDAARDVWAAAAAEVTSEAFPYDSDEVENWPTCSRLLPHALAAADHSEGLGVAAAAAGYMLNQVGLYLQQRAQLFQARAALERAVKISDEAVGSNDPLAAVRLGNLGNVLRGLGDLEGALNHAKRALGIDEEAYAPNHFAVARSLNNVGAALSELKDSEGARGYYQRALNINEVALGPDHPDLAIGLSNMGDTLLTLGEVEGAINHIKRALKIHETAYGPNHLDIATDLNNLGAALRRDGDLAGARESLQRALGISEAALGPDHPTIAIRLNNLGRLLGELGDLKGARDYLERAVDIASKSLGEEHPNTVLIRRNLESLPK